MLAIDPGPVHSGVVQFDPIFFHVQEAYQAENDDLLERLRLEVEPNIVIEVMQSMGMAVTQATFDTQLWAGRFIEAAERSGGTVRTVYRRDVKLHLCRSMRAKDTHVVAAAKSRFEPSGGGKDPYKGTKKEPGPLYGISGNDVWSALSIAVMASETQ